MANLSFQYFPYAVDAPEKNTADIIRSMAPTAEAWEISKELALLQVPESVLDQPFETLSKGEQTKIMIVALFLGDETFLLIDEPTNHLDEAGRALLCAYLKRKKGFILVSHDRHFFDGCIDHILAINRSNIEVQKGNFSSWYTNKMHQDAHERAQNDVLQREIHRLQKTVREKAAWSDAAERRKKGINPLQVDVKMGYAPKQAAKAKKSMARAKAIQGRQEAAIAEKSSLLKNVEYEETLALSPLRYHSERLAMVRDLSVGFDTRTVFQGLGFDIHRGDRIALCGPNGSGKSTVLKLLCGEQIRHAGTVDIGRGVIISYVSQSTDALSGVLPAYADRYGIDRAQFFTILHKMDVSRTQFDVPMESFSAGQKKKVLLARSLCEQAHLYVWDEPLNYIDVMSRMQIETLVTTYRPTMIFVEHDAAFRAAVATRTIHIDPARQA